VSRCLPPSLRSLVQDSGAPAWLSTAAPDFRRSRPLGGASASAPYSRVTEHCTMAGGRFADCRSSRSGHMKGGVSIRERRRRRIWRLPVRVQLRERSDVIGAQTVAASWNDGKRALLRRAILAGSSLRGIPSNCAAALFCGPHDGGSLRAGRCPDDRPACKARFSSAEPG
jgi:hypothetical protein